MNSTTMSAASLTKQNINLALANTTTATSTATMMNAIHAMILSSSTPSSSPKTSNNRRRGAKPGLSRWNTVRQTLLKASFRNNNKKDSTSFRSTANRQRRLRRMSRQSQEVKPPSSLIRRDMHGNEYLSDDDEDDKSCGYSRQNRRGSICSNVSSLSDEDSSLCSSTVASSYDSDRDEDDFQPPPVRRVRFAEEYAIHEICPQYCEYEENEDENSSCCSSKESLWWTKKERKDARKNMLEELQRLRSNAEYLEAISLVLYYAARQQGRSSSSIALPSTLSAALQVLADARGLERYIVQTNAKGQQQERRHISSIYYDINKAPKKSVSTIVRVQRHSVDTTRREESLAFFYQPFSDYAGEWASLLATGVANDTKKVFDREVVSV